MKMIFTITAFATTLLVTCSATVIDDPEDGLRVLMFLDQNEMSLAKAALKSKGHVQREGKTTSQLGEMEYTAEPAHRYAIMGHAEMLKAVKDYRKKNYSDACQKGRMLKRMMDQEIEDDGYATTTYDEWMSETELSEVNKILGQTTKSPRKRRKRNSQLQIDNKRFRRTWNGIWQLTRCEFTIDQFNVVTDRMIFERPETMIIEEPENKEIVKTGLASLSKDTFSRLGYSPAELKRIGFSRDDLMEIGFSEKDLKSVDGREGFFDKIKKRKPERLAVLHRLVSESKRC